MTAKDKFHKVMKEFSEGRLFSHDKKVEDLSQARAIAFSEARKINPKFDLGGLFQEQEGVTDENAETFWIILREIYVDTEKVNPTYRDIKWKYLPRENKNDFKRWLFTPTAADGMKLEGPSHDEGGIPGVIKETARPIEVEGGEVIINKRSMKIRDHFKCEGTPEGIASRINELEGNGIKFSDEPGQCHLKKEIMEKGRKLTSDEKIFIEIDGSPAISLKEFIEANTVEDTIMIDSTEISTIERLNIGEEVELGGGASATYKVKRVNKRGLNFLKKEIKEGDLVEVINDDDEHGHYKMIGKVKGIVSSKKHQDNYVVKFPGIQGEYTYIRSELKKIDEMKKGSKIKSKIEKDDIQEMIIQDNELREKAEEGMKTSEQFIKINEPDIFEMMKFIKNEKPYYKKAVKFIFKGADVCIYEYNLELQKFLDKYTIYYTLFDSRDEVIEYFMRLIPDRRKANLRLI